MSTYVVQEEPTGLWVADCCSQERGCEYGDIIGTYPTRKQAEAAERAHMTWHRQLEAEERAHEADRLANLARISEWRHSAICEKYATVSTKECLCGLADWQRWARNNRLGARP